MSISFSIALIVFFIHFCTLRNMVLHPLTEWLSSFLPEWVMKPLLTCPVCMTPWWGLLIIGTFQQFNVIPIFGWIPAIFYLLCSAGLNCIGAILLKWFDVLMLKEEQLEMNYEQTSDDRVELGSKSAM